MKRIIIPVALALIVSAAVFALGQAKRNNALEAELTAQADRAGTAWKNKDKQFFQDAVTDSAQFVLYFGVFSKEQILQAINHNCTFDDLVVDNTKVTVINSETAVLTSRVAQKAICDGKREPSPHWSSTTFVKRKGKWLIAFYQETPITQ